METRKKRVPIATIAMQVYEYLVEYNSTNGYMPTQYEIAHHFTNPVTGEKYTSAWASNCLQELARAGRIKLLENKHRGIELL